MGVPNEDARTILWQFCGCLVRKSSVLFESAYFPVCSTGVEPVTFGSGDGKRKSKNTKNSKGFRISPDSDVPTFADPDLSRVVSAWASLPAEHIRRAVLALVSSS
jgi:hypothetical protein